MKNGLDAAALRRSLLLAATWPTLTCSSASAAAPPTDTPAKAAYGVPSSLSLAAAIATAANNPLCSNGRLGPYYWEIGNAEGALVSGSTGPGAGTVMSVASGSKWLYVAYVFEKLSSTHPLDPEADLPYLHFTSGYTRLGNMVSAAFCGLGEVITVDDCLNATPVTGQQDPATVGKFDYDSGHMQKHASLHGLGAVDGPMLSQAVGQALGVSLNYAQPLVAAGVHISAAQYAVFLRKLLKGELNLAASLGAHAVCTNPTDTAHGCSPDASLPAPIPESESWHYALGHWVEDDPVMGDGAFSSPGALGFYPWIDSEKRFYGVISRQRDGDEQGFASGYESAQCGRLIRQAFVTGREQTGTQPD
ncbi:MAG TPA: hypothetical protein VLA61_28625 [Ideonella sp.]|uniref:hypothetical protein n=1 Tax=Ideonella sp. TaxID=1929293 RepID=UPI002C53237D|nr:hypothetical protein [Ideonella sp.]HSI52250.1 hypothetical protein [Ideonella sp.]